MLLGALSGFTVGITADRRREEQAELITRHGGAPLVGPVTRAVEPVDARALPAATRELVADPPDVVVLSTAVGVRRWFTAAESMGLGDGLAEILGVADVVARGPKATGAALALGIGTGRLRTAATYAEVVDDLRSRRRRGGGVAARVAVQLDGHDSGGIARRLEELGFDVVPVRVYRSGPPEDPAPALRLVVAVADRLVDAVTFTSPYAVDAFADLARSERVADEMVRALNSHVVACCVGPITAAAVRSIGVVSPIEPSSPRLGSMVHTLVEAFEGRASRVEFGGRSVLVQGRLVVVGDDEPVRLADRERAVLDVLMRKPGAVVSKRDLIDRVWSGAADDHAVEVTVGRLRRRLGAAGSSIDTVVRRGYRLDVG